MKTLDKIFIIIFNLCILFTSIITPALIIASSKEYYRDQFEKNKIYSHVDDNGIKKSKVIPFIGGDGSVKAVFSDDQLNTIIDHTVDYLFGDKESFALKLDEVYIMDKGYTDEVEIFGETAVAHMSDVKSLMKTAMISAIACAAVALILLIWFVLRARDVGKSVVRFTLIFYASLFGFALLFCAGTLITSGAGTMDAFLYHLWGNIHHLLFPFQPEKYKNSFFNDTLTYILNLDLFINAVVIVLCVAVCILSLWILGALLLKKHSKKQIN